MKKYRSNEVIDNRNVKKSLCHTEENHTESTQIASMRVYEVSHISR